MLTTEQTGNVLINLENIWLTLCRAQAERTDVQQFLLKNLRPADPPSVIALNEASFALTNKVGEQIRQGIEQLLLLRKAIIEKNQ
jgi:hypothetical protein